MGVCGFASCNYILEAKQQFGNEVQVVFQSHNWPHWGNEIANEYLENTACIYKFIHDQTLYYVNKGYTATEISHMLHLPAKLEKVWYTRQYYGTLSHNIKAVYQKYMGRYDANPVNLDLLPPVETAKKVVEYMGVNRNGADATATGTKMGLYNYFCGDHTALDITGNSDAVASLTPQSLDIPGNFGVIEP